MKIDISIIKKIRRAIDRGSSVSTISEHYGIDKKKVLGVYRQYRYEQIANSPRLILSKKIYQLQKAANKALKSYNKNSYARPEFAYAISSLNNELRSSLQDLGGLLDITEISNRILDYVLYPNIIDAVQIFIKELGSARDQVVMELDSASGKIVNGILLELIQDMKGKLNELRIKGIERTEKTLEVDLDSRRNELISFPEEKEKPKLKVFKNTGT